MPVPIKQMWTVATYVLGQRLRGKERYPLVLMLEPLYRCNLACAGCGKIQYPANVLKSQLSVEDCLRAVDECGAPMVSIPGGEPLMHPEIDVLVRELVARGKYIYLCTNGLLLKEKLHLFEPSKQLSFSVHMDGLEADHDNSVCREGTYRTAYEAIEAALEAGFRVTTNTTLFEGADADRTREFFDEMMELGVEGMMVSPGYSYDKAPDQGHFLQKDRTTDLFQRIFRGDRRRWRFNQSPLFIEYLTGQRDYDCTPWAMPTFSVFGWQKPCYLLQDGYEPHFDDLLSKTKWEDFGHASGNPRCQNCMVHSGFEGSAVNHTFGSWDGLFAMARAFFFGPQVGTAPSETLPISLPQVHTETDEPGRGFAAEASPQSLRSAFEYRGDVTLEMQDGDSVEGYVSNLRDSELELWNRGATSVKRIPIDQIRRVEFTGKDTADGRSWETWMKKQEAEASAANPAR